MKYILVMSSFHSSRMGLSKAVLGHWNRIFIQYEMNQNHFIRESGINFPLLKYEKLQDLAEDSPTGALPLYHIRASPGVALLVHLWFPEVAISAKTPGSAASSKPFQEQSWPVSSYSQISYSIPLVVRCVSTTPFVVASCAEVCL